MRRSAPVILHPGCASNPIGQLAGEEKETEKRGAALPSAFLPLFLEGRGGACSPSLHIHSCEVGGDRATGEHYSIYEPIIL